ncbi:MAG: VWA domain-containing protein [Candidatus Heimdallarchaeota archaeon]|nr:VWA domain-containing protein [Candidatus Heimdallarchaeota archaeon]
MNNSIKLTMSWGEDISPSNIYLHGKDLEALGIPKGTLLEVTDEISGTSFVSTAYEGENIEQGSFLANQSFSEAMGFMEGFEYDLLAYQNGFKPIKKVTITPGRIGEESEKNGADPIANINLIKELMDGLILGREYSLSWPEEGFMVKVKKTEPPIQTGEIFRFDKTEHDLSIETVAEEFNGILVFDISSSMSKRDIDAQNTETILAAFNNLAQHELSQLEPLLKEVENRPMIRRLDTAALAALVFLEQKIGRGKGEKVGLIGFSDDATVLTTTVDDNVQNFFNVDNIGRKGLAQLLMVMLVTNFWQRAQQSDKRGTNLEAALLKAIELADQMDVANPETGQENTMIVLLTDGRFTSGRSPTEVVYKHIKDRPKTVVHVIGIGEADEDLYKAVAEYGHGSFKKFTQVDDLTSYYSRLANAFKMDLRKEEAEPAEETEESTDDNSEEKELEKEIQELKDSMDN